MNWKREHNERTLEALIPELEAKHGAEVALGEAARWTQVGHIQRLVDLGTDVNCRIGERQVTPLMMAGKKAAAKMLLELGADVNATDAEGHTALMWLFIQHFRKHEALSRVKLLLSHRADTEILDAGGLSAYDHAIRRGDSASAELIRIPNSG